MEKNYSFPQLKLATRADHFGSRMSCANILNRISESTEKNYEEFDQDGVVEELDSSDDSSCDEDDAMQQMSAAARFGAARKNSILKDSCFSSSQREAQREALQSQQQLQHNGGVSGNGTSYQTSNLITCQ